MGSTLAFMLLTPSSRLFAVPEDLTSILQEYTEQGYRVIALGRRTLSDTSYTKIQRMRREDVEHDLEFLGMIVLENRLKPETEPVIGVLKGACVKIVMITGGKEKDHLELFFLGSFSFGGLRII
jgi:Cation transport ATPase